MKTCEEENRSGRGYICKGGCACDHCIHFWDWDPNAPQPVPATDDADGWCKLHSRPMSAMDECEDFHCHMLPLSTRPSPANVPEYRTTPPEYPK